MRWRVALPIATALLVAAPALTVSAQIADPERYDSESFLRTLPYVVHYWKEPANQPYQHAALKPVIVLRQQPSGSTLADTLVLQTRLADWPPSLPAYALSSQYFYYVPYGYQGGIQVRDAGGVSVSLISTGGPVAPDAAAAREIEQRIWRYADMRAEYQYRALAWRPDSVSDTFLYSSATLAVAGILSIIFGNDDWQQGGAVATVLGATGIGLELHTRRRQAHHQRRLLEIEAEFDAIHAP